MSTTKAPNRLRAWRLAHGLSMAEVADLVGLSEGAVSRIERGERGVAPLTRVRIARGVGVRVSELFGIDEDAQASNRKAARHLGQRAAHA